MTMHVAISGWLLGEPSGANRRLLALVTRAGALLADDERLTVLHPRGFVPPAASARVDWRAVDIPPRPAWRRVLAERRTLPSLLRELGATVLDHGFLPLPRVPVPACLLVHDTRAADGLSRWPAGLATAVLGQSCRRAAAIVVPSAWTRTRLHDLGVGGALPAVVANGVELPPSSGDTPIADHLLHVGHLDPRKHLAVLLRALALVAPTRRPSLVLVGRDAGDGARLRRLASRTGTTTHVRFAGVVDDAAIAALYRTARAVVVPSLHEGFGLCVLEGLAHGRPVLASSNGALPEVAGGRATLLPPHDEAAWAAAIAAPCDDTAVARQARRARAAEFSWDAAARQQLAVWREVHERHRGGQPISQTMPTTMPTASNSTPA